MVVIFFSPPLFAVTPKHFSNYFRNFLLKNNFFKRFLFPARIESTFNAPETFIMETMWRRKTMAQFLIYSSLKALCRITICKIKTKQENYQRKKYRFCVQVSFNYSFFCEWPVADDKRMAGVAFILAVWKKKFKRRENYNIRKLTRLSSGRFPK